MRRRFRNRSQAKEKRRRRLIMVLAMAGAIASMSSTIPLRVLADDLETKPPEKNVASKTKKNRLPSQLALKLRKDLGTRLSVPPGHVSVVESSYTIWPNGCLGLAQAGELCTQALVEGWRVKLTDRSGGAWVYRMNLNGTAMRLERCSRFVDGCPASP